MIEPHSEQMGASLETGAKGSFCWGSGSVGRSLGLSPASLTAYSGPRKRAPIQRLGSTQCASPRHEQHRREYA